MLSTSFERHRHLLEIAIDACEKGYSRTACPEWPSSKFHEKEVPVAAGLCGTLVDENIYQTIESAAASFNSKGRVLRQSSAYAHPNDENARTATPLILQVDAEDKDLYAREHLGPASLVISSDNADHALISSAVVSGSSRRSFRLPAKSRRKNVQTI